MGVEEVLGVDEGERAGCVGVRIGVEGADGALLELGMVIILLSFAFALEVVEGVGLESESVPESITAGEREGEREEALVIPSLLVESLLLAVLSLCARLKLLTLFSVSHASVNILFEYSYYIKK